MVNANIPVTLDIETVILPFGKVLIDRADAECIVARATQGIDPEVLARVRAALDRREPNATGGPIPPPIADSDPFQWNEPDDGTCLNSRLGGLRHLTVRGDHA